MTRRLHLLLLAASISATLCSCRNEQEIFIPERDPAGEPEPTALTGFYLLNEGNMGSNKATLDLYTFANGIYARNIYAEANPDVPKELGDVGNDMRAHGSKLWLTVNCSNKVEVLDLATARRLGQVDIPNCRYLAFHDGSAFVTSYAGPVEINPDYSQRGFVARIDTLTLHETGRATVGFQPDGIAVAGGLLYVANSGGYRVPAYENCVSVIDPESMRLIDEFVVAENLELIEADQQGRLWISSRGDYFDTPSRLHVYDPADHRVIARFDTPVSAMWMHGDSLFTVADGHFCIFNTSTVALASRCFITDGTESEIVRPYGIAVSPADGNIYLTDAGNYVTPGTLRRYTPDGRLILTHRTGDIPKKIAFF